MLFCFLRVCVDVGRVLPTRNAFCVGAAVAVLYMYAVFNILYGVSSPPPPVLALFMFMSCSVLLVFSSALLSFLGTRGRAEVLEHAHHNPGRVGGERAARIG